MPDLTLDVEVLKESDLKQLIVIAAIAKHPHAGESISIQRFTVRTHEELSAAFSKWIEWLNHDDWKVTSTVMLHVPREVLKKVIDDDSQ